MKYSYKEVKKTKDSHEYEVTVDYKELVPFEESSYQKLSKEIKIDGFRPGKAPKEKMLAKLGSKVIIDAINSLLPVVTYEVMKEVDAKPASSPEYDLKKVDEKEGVIFTFKFVNYPEVKLGDLSKIKIKKEGIEVKDKEADEVIKNIVKSSLKPEKIKELTKVKEAKGKKGEKDQSLDFELNDELIKELGYDDEKTVVALRKTVMAKLEDMKKQQVENDYVTAVVKEAVKLSKFEIPQAFTDNDIHASEHQFTDRLEELKLDPETYLKTQGTTLEAKRKEWEKEAVERISVDLVLIKIANDYGDVASDEDIEAEIEKITDPKVKSQYDAPNAREYVRTVLTRQKGVQKLVEIVEGKAPKKKK